MFEDRQYCINVKTKHVMTKKDDEDFKNSTKGASH